MKKPMVTHYPSISRMLLTYLNNWMHMYFPTQVDGHLSEVKSKPIDVWDQFPNQQQLYPSKDKLV